MQGWVPKAKGADRRCLYSMPTAYASYDLSIFSLVTSAISFHLFIPSSPLPYTFPQSLVAFSMAFPSPTKTWHTKPYASISPTRPELSTAGKTVLITGGGSGIGPMFARSFAASGAAAIVLIGRTKATLVATQADLLEAFPSTKIYTFPVDISDAKALNEAMIQLMDFLKSAGQSPKIDILVANAAYMHNRYSVGTADEDDWWRTFTVNVLGNFNLMRAFLPHAAHDAVVLYVSSGADHVPYVPGLSGYASSKLAATKVFDYLAVENPGLHVRQFHPGAVETTEQGIKSGVKGEDDREFKSRLSPTPPFTLPPQCRRLTSVCFSS
jgi:NAD(P)-dependent dehydrogenase (short-subunit alcohol dehydrogenase family)